MTLQISNSIVVQKVDRLAKTMGLSKTAVVERAVDRLLYEISGLTDQTERITALLAQLDRIPDRSDAYPPIDWDEHGLPR